MSVADTLDRWLQDQRLTVMDVSRAGEVSRNTIYGIRSGAKVGPGVLRRIARGIATDPHTRVMSPSVYLAVVRDLFAAADLDLPTDELVSATLEDEIARLVKNRADAASIARALERFPHLSQARREMLIAAARAVIDD